MKRFLVVTGCLIFCLGLVACADFVQPEWQLSIVGDGNDVSLDKNEEYGDGDLNDEGGCCDDDEELDYSRCWSTCRSKNLLEPEECAACQRGERDCVWPWEIDIECLQE